MAVLNIVALALAMTAYNDRQTHKVFVILIRIDRTMFLSFELHSGKKILTTGQV